MSSSKSPSKTTNDPRQKACTNTFTQAGPLKNLWSFLQAELTPKQFSRALAKFRDIRIHAWPWSFQGALLQNNKMDASAQCFSLQVAKALVGLTNLLHAGKRPFTSDLGILGQNLMVSSCLGSWRIYVWWRLHSVHEAFASYATAWLGHLALLQNKNDVRKRNLPSANPEQLHQPRQFKLQMVFADWVCVCEIRAAPHSMQLALCIFQLPWFQGKYCAWGILHISTKTRQGTVVPCKSAQTKFTSNVFIVSS